LLLSCCLTGGAVLAAAEPADEVAALKARVTRLEAELKEVRKLLGELQAAQRGTPPPARPQRLAAEVDLVVVPGEWGNAGPADIRAVCVSAAQELGQHFPQRLVDPIAVSYSQRGPMVVYGRGPQGERRVWLNVQGTFWAQLAFQFGHEYCHILCNYRDGNQANLWFEESLCETASLFVLRRMAETWKTKPPYSNWKSYGEKLSDYAADRLKVSNLPPDLTLAQWYQRHAEALRKSGVDREKNQIVAGVLLPLLEKEPQHWAAIGSLNQAEAGKEISFQDYLRDWHQRVPAAHKPFVAEVAKRFGLPVE